MTSTDPRDEICAIGRRLWDRGLVAGSDGNISVRLDDGGFLCTPTGISKGFMRPDDLCTVDAAGAQLAGGRRRTSEILLHLAIYRARPDVRAVVHSHPPHATAFAVAREPIPRGILAEVELFLGEVPTSPYETTGTQRFADTIAPYVAESNTILLASHGLVAFAATLERAWFQTEIADAYCRTLLLARQLGPVHWFGERELRELLDLKQRLGLPDPRQDQERLTGPSVFAGRPGVWNPEARAFRRPDAE